MKCVLSVTCSQHACSTRCLLTSSQQDGPLRSPDRCNSGCKLCAMTTCTVSTALGVSLLLLLSVSCQTGFACSDIGLPLAGAISERFLNRLGSDFRRGKDALRLEIAAVRQSTILDTIDKTMALPFITCVGHLLY